MQFKNLAVVIAIAALVGCGSDATAPADPADAAVGTYLLTQVNGGPLPAMFFQNSAGRLEVISGALTLRSDRSFTESRNIRTTYTSGPAQVTAAVDNGGFSVTGSQITFSIAASGAQAGISYTGAVGPSEVAYTWNNVAYRYQKQ